jgi:hypothetical protein
MLNTGVANNNNNNNFSSYLFTCKHNRPEANHKVSTSNNNNNINHLGFAYCLLDAGFFLGLLFSREGSGYMLPRNVG